MNVATIFLLSAIVGVAAFGRDIIGALFKQRKRLTEDKARAIREPYEVTRIIMDSTNEAVSLQATLLLEVRTSLEEERKGRMAALADVADLKSRLESSEQRQRELYILLGQQVHQRPEKGTD